MSGFSREPVTTLEPTGSTAQVGAATTEYGPTTKGLKTTASINSKVTSAGPCDAAITQTKPAELTEMKPTQFPGEEPKLMTNLGNAVPTIRPTEVSCGTKTHYAKVSPSPTANTQPINTTSKTILTYKPKEAKTSLFYYRCR